MSGILWNFASFVIALGILVAVHEFGHFWIARRCGIKVEKFSIGFGKSIWRKVAKDGTEYSLSMIPLGGYVKMVDSRVDDVAPEQYHVAFDRKPLWQRTAVVAAGPMFNFIFAVFAYWLVFLIGVPAVKPVVGEVTPYSIAANAGLEPGMEFTSVAGVKTRDWESVNMGIISHIGDKRLTVTVSDESGIGVTKTKTLDLTEWNFNPETQSAMKTLGFLPYTPEASLTLANVSDKSAGQRAGLQVGDTLVSVDGIKLENWAQLVALIQSNPEMPIEVQVSRNSELKTLRLTPDRRDDHQGKSIGFAGIGSEVAEWPEKYRFELQYGVFESIGKSIEKTGQVIGLTATMLKKLVVGDIGLNNLSGPISIAKGAGTTADYGLVYFLGFLALISVNLGIVNLVPLPMLDGGHLLFFAIEAVIRRPVPERIQEMAFRFGGVIILSVMAIAIFNDFSRL